MSSDQTASVVTPELLKSPSPHGARVVALALATDLRTSHEPFDKGSAEGLHDLRVHARRLGSWLRAFRPELDDTVRGKTRRRLRALASATNEARDAQVALAFIERMGTVPARARAGVRDLVSRLEREGDEHARDTRRVIERDLARSAHALEDQLDHYWERHDIGRRSEAPSFAAVLGDALRDQSNRVDAALAHVASARGVTDVHRARIAIKRLRYLLEPLGDTYGADEVVAQLRLIQRELGDVRDGHVLAMRIVREIGELAARDARLRALGSLGLADGTSAGGDDATASTLSVLRPGLMEVARRARDAADAALSSFRARWGDLERASPTEGAHAVSSALRHH